MDSSTFSCDETFSSLLCNSWQLEVYCGHPDWNWCSKQLLGCCNPCEHMSKVKQHYEIRSSTGRTSTSFNLQNHDVIHIYNMYILYIYIIQSHHSESFFCAHLYTQARRTKTHRVSVKENLQEPLNLIGGNRSGSILSTKHTLQFTTVFTCDFWMHISQRCSKQKKYFTKLYHQSSDYLTISFLPKTDLSF